jgi:hypothetical protein
MTVLQGVENKIMDERLQKETKEEPEEEESKKDVFISQETFEKYAVMLS